MTNIVNLADKYQMTLATLNVYKARLEALKQSILEADGELEGTGLKIQKVRRKKKVPAELVKLRDDTIEENYAKNEGIIRELNKKITLLEAQRDSLIYDQNVISLETQINNCKEYSETSYYLHTENKTEAWEHDAKLKDLYYDKIKSEKPSDVSRKISILVEKSFIDDVEYENLVDYIQREWKKIK